MDDIVEAADAHDRRKANGTEDWTELPKWHTNKKGGFAPLLLKAF